MSYLFPTRPITGMEMLVRDLLRSALIIIGFVAADGAISVSPETSLALVWIVGSILAAFAFWSTWQTAFWRLRDLGLGTDGAIAGVVGLYCVIPGIVTCASPDMFFLFALAGPACVHVFRADRAAEPVVRARRSPDASRRGQVTFVVAGSLSGQKERRGNPAFVPYAGSLHAGV